MTFVRSIQTSCNNISHKLRICLCRDIDVKKISRPRSVRVPKPVTIPVVAPLSPLAVATHRVSTPASTSTTTVLNRHVKRLACNNEIHNIDVTLQSA